MFLENGQIIIQEIIVKISQFINFNFLNQFSSHGFKSRLIFTNIYFIIFSVPFKKEKPSILLFILLHLYLYLWIWLIILIKLFTISGKPQLNF